MAADTLKTDEERRVTQHERVKDEVREKVHAEIAREADRTPAERREAERLAGALKHKAVREVAATESEITRGQLVARTSQVVDYLFYLVYGIVGLEIALEAFGAREGAGFKQLIDALAAPFLRPFRGLLPDPAIGPFQFMLSWGMALVVYMLVHAAVNGLLRLFVHRKTVV